MKLNVPMMNMTKMNVMNRYLRDPMDLERAFVIFEMLLAQREKNTIWIPAAGVKGDKCQI
jgi:hypothetical protein